MKSMNEIKALRLQSIERHRRWPRHHHSRRCVYVTDKKAMLPQGNRAMPQVFFSVEVRQQHSLQV